MKGDFAYSNELVRAWVEVTRLQNLITVQADQIVALKQALEELRASK
jgi:hypothetical protein